MAYPDPVLESVFEIRVSVEESRHIGRSADEKLWFTPVTGGTVDGPRLTGEVRVAAGESLSESEYYFRTAPVFQTDAPQHRWLAENRFVGMAREEEGQICVRVLLLA